MYKYITKPLKSSGQSNEQLDGQRKSESKVAS